MNWSPAAPVFGVFYGQRHEELVSDTYKSLCAGQFAEAQDARCVFHEMR